MIIEHLEQLISIDRFLEFFKITSMEFYLLYLLFGGKL